MKRLNPSKAAGTDNLSGEFLKSGTDILARPISQLCSLSVKLNSFPKNCKIAEVRNFISLQISIWFSKNYSTNACLGHRTDKTNTGFEKDLFIGMILIDLQKASDTINHQMLIKKMKYLGFTKNVVAWFWFKSYLIGRKFKINISTSYSIPSNLTCDVPQRSILGPLSP